ncbi:hypothetical protein ACI6Q5_06315 [Xanthomonas codiaei]|uniref:Phytase-like domain-containing protein n=1 Tax=Xanthomonas codiaei TaxID=56463 RepID=A0A2S7CLP0_9XANT|nr:hypothetical protein [Xanthomonas codiaei]PPU62493.1 hypothetical protein XcodCFBP4690_14020 [Xanthomonas codiaei]
MNAFKTCCVVTALYGVGLFAGPGLLQAAPATPSTPAPEAAVAAPLQWITFDTRQTSGMRPFVPARLNGQPVSLMVHSLASFYMQTTHANAALAGIALEGETRKFGIESEGKLSALGRQYGHASELSVGDDVARGKRVEIFEVPQNAADGKRKDGMLGSLWLNDRGAIIDYRRQRLAVPANAAVAQAFDAGLVKAGYSKHALHWDDRGKLYYVLASINRVPAKMLVSTVGGDAVDVTFKDRYRLTLQARRDEQAGPAGAVVPVFDVVGPATLTLDAKRLRPSPLQAWDRNAYDSSSSESSCHGVLASGLMFENAAVIDFKTGHIFFK